MELVTALFATAVAGVETVGAGLLSSVGVGSAATGTAAASAAGSASVWGALEGTLTAGALLSSAGQAVMSVQQGDINATQSEIQAKQQALKISQDYVRQVGASRVAFAGSGVTLGSGSAAAVETSLQSQADFEKSLAAATGGANAAAAELQGVSGAVAAGGGMFKTAGNYAINVSKRG